MLSWVEHEKSFITSVQEVYVVIYTPNAIIVPNMNNIHKKIVRGVQVTSYKLILSILDLDLRLQGKPLVLIYRPKAIVVLYMNILYHK